MITKHTFPITNYSLFFITEQEGKEIQTHSCCNPNKSWSFFQSRMWQFRCVAFKQQIFLTIKGKFLSKSLLFWKGRLFFLIPPSVCKQQRSVLRVWLWCQGTSSHRLRLPKECAGKTPAPTHQLLVQCTLTLGISYSLSYEFSSMFFKAILLKSFGGGVFLFFKETSVGVF